MLFIASNNLFYLYSRIFNLIFKIRLILLKDEEISSMFVGHSG